MQCQLHYTPEEMGLWGHAPRKEENNASFKIQTPKYKTMLWRLYALVSTYFQ